MLRERIDIAILEDFVNGLARAAGCRVAAYDQGGSLITVSLPRSRFAVLGDHVPRVLALPLELVALPGGEPPAAVAFVRHDGVWHVVAPVHVHGRPVGFVGLGELRDPSDPGPPAPASTAAGIDIEGWHLAWESLPVLDRSGEGRPVATVRWAARLLGEWCRREDQLSAASDEMALVSDIGALVSGEQNLQTVLDRIVQETARAMRCKYASLRLYNPDTGELTIAAVYNLPGNYVNRGVVKRVSNPIDDEALRGNTVYVEDAQTDPRIQFREIVTKLGLRSGLVTGMIYRGQPIGTLRIYADHRRRFRTAHRHVLRAVASQAAIAIANARLFEERLRTAEIERQLALAGEVQKRMIRTRAPRHPLVESAVLFDPSSHVGGDFCDLFTLADGRLAAAVGDVVGHGVPAALLMASVRGALRAGAECGADLAGIASRLNHHVHRETSSREFVTLLIVAIDRDARRLEYCNAGHEPLLLLRGGKTIQADEGSLVLGLDPEERYAVHSLALRPGDLCLLYTDGVIEAMDFDGRHFGRERLVKSLREHGRLPLEQVLRNIRWDVRRFVGLAEQSDDLTMVGVRAIASPGS